MQTKEQQWDTTLGIKISLFEKQRNKQMSKGRVYTFLGIFLFILALWLSLVIGDVTIEKISNIPAAWNYIKETIPVLRLNSLGYDVGVWYARWDIWVGNIVDTILIAFLATFISFISAFIISFPASRNLIKSPVIFYLCRMILDIARSVPEMVYALLFVFAFSLGPLPGVLAIAVHSTGSLGKLFSEVNENISMNEVEGIKSTGGNWVQAIWFGVVPQVLPNYISYTILRLEWNIRAATVVGLVGAGGIGMELMTAIRQFQFKQISAITLMIILLVFALDFVSEKLRHQLIKGEKII